MILATARHGKAWAVCGRLAGGVRSVLSVSSFHTIRQRGVRSVGSGRVCGGVFWYLLRRRPFTQSRSLHLPSPIFLSVQLPSITTRFATATALFRHLCLGSTRDIHAGQIFQNDYFHLVKNASNHQHLNKKVLDFFCYLVDET